MHKRQRAAATAALQMWPDPLEHPAHSVSFWSPPGDGETAGARFSRTVRWPKAIKAPEMKQTILLWELRSSSRANPMRNPPGPATDFENWSDKQVSSLPGGKVNPPEFRDAQKVPPTRGSPHPPFKPWDRLFVAASPPCPPRPGREGGSDPVSAAEELPRPEAPRSPAPSPRSGELPCAAGVSPQVAATAARRDWPASRRSRTFLHSKSQALAVESRSCSLSDLRSCALAERRWLLILAGSACRPGQPRSAPAAVPLTGNGRRRRRPRPHGAAGRVTAAPGGRPPSPERRPPRPPRAAAWPPPAFLTAPSRRLAALLSSPPPPLSPPRGGEGAPGVRPGSYPTGEAGRGRPGARVCPAAACEGPAAGNGRPPRPSGWGTTGGPAPRFRGPCA